MRECNNKEDVKQREFIYDDEYDDDTVVNSVNIHILENVVVAIRQP